MGRTSGLVDYYANLLIIQYAFKPKAAATIRALAHMALCGTLIDEVDQAFNLDTAVGVQLDILGKYVGVDRYFSRTDPKNYFAFTDYEETAPDANEKHGFSTYDTFDGDNLNGTLTYNSVVTLRNSLSDDDYRKILRLRILQNHSNHSRKSIDDGLFAIFGHDLYVSASGVMSMTYTVASEIAPLIAVAFDKGVLPRGMGVEITLVTAT